MLAAPGYGAEHPSHCLKKEAQRAAITSGQAIPLAQAIKASHRRAEVVRARLCKGDNGLVYVLTLLARNGKVTRATVDAKTGILIGGR